MPSGFALTWDAATVPKSGLGPDENEDAHAADPAAGRFAVADGASEGWRSGPWARHLAATFAAAPPDPLSYPQWLAAVRAKFPRAEPDPAAASGPVAWYAETKQAEGAFATLLGIAFREPAAGGGAAWKAVAVGDSCLFQVRAVGVVAAFPLDAAGRFGNHPPLVGSVRARSPEPEWLAGRAEFGDEFLLLTDGLAEWFLRESAAGRDPARSLDEFLTAPPTTARAWVESRRTAHALRDDDSTAVRVRLEAR